MITTLGPIRITNPIDAHMHWRSEDTLMPTVAPYSMYQFVAGILMPNIKNHEIIRKADLEWYSESVHRVIYANKSNFLPMFTFFLSKDMDVDELALAWKLGMIHAVKYYPKGGTTNSGGGLAGFHEVSHILKRMQELGVPLLIHGETPLYNDEVVPNDKRKAALCERPSL